MTTRLFIKCVQTSGDIDELVREVVRTHAVARQDPQQAELVRVVDCASAGLMRTVLRDERVHALEAAWRALFSCLAVRDGK